MIRPVAWLFVVCVADNEAVYLIFLSFGLEYNEEYRVKQSVLGLFLVAIFFWGSPALAIGPFTDNGDTVLDQASGLIWQKQTADTTGNGSITWHDGVNWQEALAYCEGLILAGQSDWRLPNIRELSSLVDRSTHSPAIDPVFMCESGNYWSATTRYDQSVYAIEIDFQYGEDDSYYKSYDANYVRCVRGGLSDIEPIDHPVEPIDPSPSSGTLIAPLKILLLQKPSQP